MSRAPSSLVSATSSSLPSSGRSASTSCVHHVLVVGGSGFIGSAVCRSALRHGLTVSSLSTRGQPFAPTAAAAATASRRWTADVQWYKGDLLQPQGSWTKLLQPSSSSSSSSSSSPSSPSPFPSSASSSSSSPSPSPSSAPPIDAVVCCVGGFGGVEQMRRVNGDANLHVLRALSGNAAIRRVGFVSAFDYRLPALLQRGYIEGKRSVEAEIRALFSHSAPASTSTSSSSSFSSSSGCARAAVIARPGVVYGPRYVRALDAELPLQWLFGPLAVVTSASPVQWLRQLPLLSPVLTPLLLPPTQVDALADAIIERIMDPRAEPGVSTITVGDFHHADNTQRT